MKDYKLKFSAVAYMLILCIISCAGCVTIKERARQALGISTKDVEIARKYALKKAFNIEYNACYNKVKEALSQIGCYIYAADKAKTMFAVYVSQTDTTPVGIFLVQLEQASTQVEVSSPSDFSRDIIATKLFGKLDLSCITPKEGQGENTQK